MLGKSLVWCHFVEVHQNRLQLWWKGVDSRQRRVFFSGDLFIEKVEDKVLSLIFSWSF